MRRDDAEPRIPRRFKSSEWSKPGVRSSAKVLVTVSLALVAANCSSQQKVASNGRSLDPKYGVYASPRVIEDGQPVPKGGGRAMVGKPYQVAGRTYVPKDNPGYSRTGLASWYGADFHGRLTANGEIFDRVSLAAAHPTMPLPSYARVTNLANQRSMIVRVNDRGPYHADRVMDVSEGVAEALEFRRAGTARVRVDYVGRASIRGSDDRKLMATLRTDGAPAAHPGTTAPVMVASAEAAPSRPQALAFRGNPEPRREQNVAVAANDVEEEAEADPQPLNSIGRAATSSRITLASVENRPSPAQFRVQRPLPPERPLDLGTIPNAGTPIETAPVARLPPPRPVMAGMFFASPDAPGRFTSNDPFNRLKPQRFVSFNAHSRSPTLER